MPKVLPVPFDYQGNLCHYPTDARDAYINAKGEIFILGIDYNIPLAGGGQIPYKDADTQQRMSGARGHGPVWKDAYEFEATLTYDDYERGQSSLIFWCRNEQGLRFCFFVSEFHEVLKKKGLLNQQFHGRFGFRKQGKNYSLYLIE